MKTNKTEMPRKATAPKKEEFVITITIENSVYQGTGTTAFEALQSVPAPTLDLISSGLVRIEHGVKHKEVFLASIPMKRLLNPFNQPVLVIDLAEGL